MEFLNEVGVEWILFLQNMGSWLISILKFFTFLGTEQFYLLMLPVLYWSINTTLGLQVGLILMMSNGLNAILKIAFHTPRPTWVSSEVTAYQFESSFGAPSGHAQNSVAVWGVIASFLNKSWTWGIAVLIMLFIGISRIGLGVHFPIDVLAGWIIGAILLYLFNNLYKPVGKWLRKMDRGRQVLVALAFTLVFLLLGSALILFTMQTSVLPEAWIQNAAAASSGRPINPYSLDALLSSTGALFGISAGAIMLRSQGGFQVKGSLIQHVLRYLLGMLGLLSLWAGLDLLFPDAQNLISYGLRYLRYALMGAWVSWWAPLLFVRLGWASGGKPNKTETGALTPGSPN